MSFSNHHRGLHQSQSSEHGSRRTDRHAGRWSQCGLFAMLAMLAVFVIGGAAASIVAADEPVATPIDAPKAVQPDDAPETKELSREERICKYLTGANFVGSYTVDRGDRDSLRKENYGIKKCEKLPEGDKYRITAKIQYGDVDGEFPMDLEILWAGNTPVITLDNVWIPALGTFSSRVLILNGRYSGTWDHNDVGGHLFGRIEKPEK